MSPAEARYAADFRREVYDPIVLTFRPDGVQRAAYEIVTGGEATFASFQATLGNLQHTLTRLGASHLAEPARSELLDEGLPRVLIAAIGDWGRKWAAQQAGADDAWVWDQRVRAWAEASGLREPGSAP
jgi:hypothetical protein